MFDALTIAAIVDEMQTLLVGGRVQHVVHVDALTVTLEVYASRQRRWLTLSADPRFARAVIVDARVDGDAERVSPFLLLLRKYARGGRIVSVSQPRYERILRLSIVKAQEADKTADDRERVDEGLQAVNSTHTDLVVELMGRRSNLMLVDERGRIMESVKRVTAAMSRARTVLPGQLYTPPPQNKVVPHRVTAAALLAAAHEASEPYDTWLVGQVVAVSPLLAREIAHRTSIATSMPAAALTREQADATVEALRELFAPLDGGGWRPMVYAFPNGKAEFTPFPLRSLDAAPGVFVTSCASVSAATVAALERDAGEAAPGRHTARRERLVAEIDDVVDKLRHRLNSLHEQQAQGAASASWRDMGEAIYAHWVEIAPGATELRTPEGLIVTLDPKLSPSDNAQHFFERYRKAQAATANVPTLLEATERDLAYVEQLRLQARLAETYDEIETTRLEWLAYNDSASASAHVSRPKGARPSAAARRPRSYQTPDGDTLLIGRSGPQNETVTFGLAGPDDLWLHARDMPGAHVILRGPGTESGAAIERAAALAAWHSEGRGSTSVAVDVTARRYVRKIKGAGPGMVTYRNEHTLNVRPRSEIDLHLTPHGT